MKNPLYLWLGFLVIVFGCVGYMAYHSPTFRTFVISTMLFVILFPMKRGINHARQTYKPIPKVPQEPKKTIKPITLTSRSKVIR